MEGFQRHTRKSRFLSLVSSSSRTDALGWRPTRPTTPKCRSQSTFLCWWHCFLNISAGRQGRGAWTAIVSLKSTTSYQVMNEGTALMTWLTEIGWNWLKCLYNNMGFASNAREILTAEDNTTHWKYLVVSVLHRYPSSLCCEGGTWDQGGGFKIGYWALDF